MINKHRFSVTLPLRTEEELHWWFRAVDEYEVRPAYRNRSEYLNLASRLEAHYGNIPWSVETSDACDAVTIYDPENGRGDALAAAMLISAFMREHPRAQVRFTYATVPMDDGKPGPCGGGSIWVGSACVAYTTAEDPFTFEHAAQTRINQR